MLDLRRYKQDDRAAVRMSFCSIFDAIELHYFDASAFNGPSIVGIDESGAVGAFLLMEQTPEGYTDYEIAYIGVIPAWRRHGYAKRLIRTVQEVIGNKGVWLKVLKRNHGACRLYTDLGFVIGEQYKTKTGIGLTLVWGVAYECCQCYFRLDPATVKWVGSGKNLQAFCSKCRDRLG